MSKVWLITGCSSGFGREIALAAVRRGDTVVATARNVSKIEDLEKLGLRIINKRLDVLDSDEQIKEIIADVVRTVGRIDILVNNAGYILEGAIEECRYVLTPSKIRSPNCICTPPTRLALTSSQHRRSAEVLCHKRLQPVDSYQSCGSVHASPG